MGDAWYLYDDPHELAEATDQAVASVVDDAAALVSRWPTVRQALHGLLFGIDAYAARHFSYDESSCEFTAGTLYYEEGLLPFLAFLALARGSEDLFEAEGWGAVVIHDDVFAPDEDDATAAAVMLGPERFSRVLLGDEPRAVMAIFQSIADLMLADRNTLPPPVDQLDELR